MLIDTEIESVLGIWIGNQETRCSLNRSIFPTISQQNCFIAKICYRCRRFTPRMDVLCHVTFQWTGPLVVHITRLLFVKRHLSNGGGPVKSGVLVVPLPLLVSWFSQPRHIVQPFRIADHLQAGDLNSLSVFALRVDLGCQTAGDPDMSPRRQAAGYSMCGQPCHNLPDDSLRQQWSHF